MTGPPACPAGIGPGPLAWVTNHHQPAASARHSGLSAARGAVPGEPGRGRRDPGRWRAALMPGPDLPVMQVRGQVLGHLPGCGQAGADAVVLVPLAVAREDAQTLTRHGRPLGLDE